MAEIVACPSCQRKLQVPEQYLGHSVQCPECRHTFTAAAMATNAPPAPPAAPKNDERRRDDYDDDRRSRRGRYGDDEDDRDYGMGRRLRYRDDYAPHRGGMILALGLVALIGGWVTCGLLFVVGPVAWIMGNADLREIRAGRMDPVGEGMTRSGQVCGIVATVFMILGVLVFCLALVADRH